MAKKEIKCEACKYFENGECKHFSNILIVIRNRKETITYSNKPKDLVKSCKNYKENGI